MVQLFILPIYATRERIEFLANMELPSCPLIYVQAPVFLEQLYHSFPL